MSKPNFTYNAIVDRVLDGDTIDVIIELFKDITLKARLRLAGINTPETKSKDEKERKAGGKAMDALIEILGFIKGQRVVDGALAFDFDHGPKVVVKIVGQEKFGRWLAEVYTPNLTKSAGIQSKSVNEWMVEQGHAKRYDGGKRWIGPGPENPFLTLADDVVDAEAVPHEPLTEDPA